MAAIVAWVVWVWELDPGQLHSPDRETAEGVAALMYPHDTWKVVYRGRAVGTGTPRWDVYRQRIACHVWAATRPVAELEARRIVGASHYATVQSVASWEVGKADRRWSAGGTNDGASAPGGTDE